MAILDEVKSMQSQGMSEGEIISSLQQQGISYKEISDALSQSKIKAAIDQPETDPEMQYSQNLAQQQTADPYSEQYAEQPLNPAMQGMQQSMMQSPEYTQEQALPNYGQSQGDYQGYSEYGQYDYTSPAISPDTMTEIAEQIVSERLIEVRKKIESAINLKTTFETKVDSIEERLKRIEKIMDTLQTSVLRKVGDYLTNVNDIKKELIETQKSFTKLSSKKSANPCEPTEQHESKKHHKHKK